MKTILNFALYFAVIAIAAAAPPIVVPSTQGVTVNINGAIAYPDHSMFFQTFDEESREDIVPNSASQIGLQTTDKTLWVATGTEAGDWAPLITKAMLGLANVDNTSDVDKPISAATQSALDGKQNALTAGTGVTINSGTISIGQSVGTTDSVTFGGVYTSGVVSASEASFGSALSVMSGVVQLTGITNASDLHISKAVIDASDSTKVFRVNSSGNFLPIELNGVYPGNAVGIKFLSQNVQAGFIQYNPSSGLSILSFPRLNLLTSDDNAKVYLVQTTNSRGTARTMIGRQIASASSNDLVGLELIGASTVSVSPGHGIRTEYTLNRGGGTSNSGVLAGYDSVRYTDTTSGAETTVRVFGVRSSGTVSEPVEINGDGIAVPSIKDSAAGLKTGQFYIDPVTRAVHVAP